MDQLIPHELMQRMASLDTVGYSTNGTNTNVSVLVPTVNYVLAKALDAGEWMYPETNLGSSSNFNLSVFCVDLFLIIFFLASWTVAMFTTQVKNPESPTPLQLQQVTDYCLKGGFSGGRIIGMNRYVSFFTMEEVTNWLGVSIFVLISIFKIICGASNANASMIAIAIGGGLFTKFMRQGMQKQPVKQLATFLAIFSVMLTLWAYTDSFSTRHNDINDLNNGRNMLYFAAGVVFFCAAIIKTLITMQDTNKDEAAANKILSENLWTNNFAYYMTGWSIAVVGTIVVIFFFCESILVAYAATKWYALPFYFLYVVPFYYFVTTAGSFGKGDSMAHVYNLFLTVLGTLIIILSQAHVCSFPGPGGKEIVAGCGKLRFGINKFNHGDQELTLNQPATAALGILSTAFVFSFYVGTRFSASRIAQTIQKVCDTGYSEKV